MSSEIEKLLEELEWSILSPFPRCPICRILKSTGTHDEDCELNHTTEFEALRIYEEGQTK